MGNLIEGKPREILLNPTYGPMVARGYDPAVLDSGMLSNDYRLNNLNYSFDSHGLDGLESVSWKTKLLKGRTLDNADGTYSFEFNYPTKTLIKDVIFDIQNNRYATADIDYFSADYVGDVTPMTTADTFQVKTYLKFEFYPDDTSQPVQTEFVRVDIPYRRHTESLWVMLLSFLVVMVIMLSLAMRLGLFKFSPFRFGGGKST